MQDCFDLTQEHPNVVLACCALLTLCALQKVEWLAKGYVHFHGENFRSRRSLDGPWKELRRTLQELSEALFKRLWVKNRSLRGPSFLCFTKKKLFLCAASLLSVALWCIFFQLLISLNLAMFTFIDRICEHSLVKPTPLFVKRTESTMHQKSKTTFGELGLTRGAR